MAFLSLPPSPLRRLPAVRHSRCPPPPSPFLFTRSPLRARALAIPGLPPSPASNVDLLHYCVKLNHLTLASQLALHQEEIQLHKAFQEDKEVFLEDNKAFWEDNKKLNAALYEAKMSLALLERHLASLRQDLFRAEYNLDIRGILMMFANRQDVYLKAAGRAPSVVGREKWKSIILENGDFARCLQSKIPDLLTVEETAEFLISCEEAFHAVQHRAVQAEETFVFDESSLFDKRAKHVIICMAEQLSIPVEFVSNFSHPKIWAYYLMSRDQDLMV